MATINNPDIIMLGQLYGEQEITDEVVPRNQPLRITGVSFEEFKNRPFAQMTFIAGAVVGAVFGAIGAYMTINRK